MKATFLLGLVALFEGVQSADLRHRSSAKLEAQAEFDVFGGISQFFSDNEWFYQAECCHLNPSWGEKFLGAKTCASSCKKWKPSRNSLEYPGNGYRKYTLGICKQEKYECVPPSAMVQAAAKEHMTVEAYTKFLEDAETAQREAALELKRAQEKAALEEAALAKAKKDAEDAEQALVDAADDANTDALEQAIVEADEAELVAGNNAEDANNDVEEAKTNAEDADAEKEKTEEESRTASLEWCPDFTIKKNTDPGLPTWTDASHSILEAMPDGKKSDNAGEWTQEEKEWHMNAQILTPTKEELFEKVYTLGSNVFVVTSRDGYGNLNHCRMNVVVEDHEPPVIAPCPDSRLEKTEAGKCYFDAEWAKPQPTDNVKALEAVVTHQPGKYAPGTKVVSWSVKDTSENSANCSFSVSVEDREAPTMTCPKTVTHKYPNGTNDQCAQASRIEYKCQSSAANGQWDNCAGVDLSDVICTTDMPHQFPLGTTDVSCSLTDTSGNSVTRFTEVVIIDITPPHITCPDNRRVELGDGPTVTLTDLEDATGLDNSCEVTVTCETTNPGKDMEPGFHTVAWNARDKAGHQTDCSYTIEVADVTAPEWSHCPGADEDIQVNNQHGEEYKVVEWDMPTASDNAGDDQVTYGGDYEKFISGLAYPLGLTHIKYSAKDPTGNEAICEFDVLVHDNEKPRFVQGDLVDKNCGQGDDGVATGDICEGKQILVGSHDEETRANTDVEVETIGAQSCCISGDVCAHHPDSTLFKVCGAAVIAS